MSESTYCLSCQQLSRIPLCRGRCFGCFETGLQLIEAGLTTWEYLEITKFASPNISNGIKRLLTFVTQNGIAYCQLCDWRCCGKGNSNKEKEDYIHSWVNKHLTAFHDQLVINKEVFKLGIKSRKFPRITYRGS